jgi:hypothetical protein
MSTATLLYFFALTVATAISIVWELERYERLRLH